MFLLGFIAAKSDSVVVLFASKRYNMLKQLQIFTYFHYVTMMHRNPAAKVGPKSAHIVSHR